MSNVNVCNQECWTPTRAGVSPTRQPKATLSKARSHPREQAGLSGWLGGQLTGELQVGVSYFPSLNDNHGANTGVCVMGGRALAPT